MESGALFGQPRSATCWRAPSGHRRQLSAREAGLPIEPPNPSADPELAETARQFEVDHPTLADPPQPRRIPVPHGHLKLYDVSSEKRRKPGAEADREE
jgi:hypothetical protein